MGFVKEIVLDRGRSPIELKAETWTLASTTQEKSET